MKTALKIVVLAENTAEGRGIRGEHGLAFLVERDGKRLLFDTGQGLDLADNAKVLNRDLTKQRPSDWPGRFVNCGGLTSPRSTRCTARDLLRPPRCGRRCRGACCRRARERT